MDGDRPTTGPLPVPVRVTVWGLPGALSATVSDAERLPGTVGAKVTLMVQFPPASTEVPQLLLWPKSPGLAPASVRPVILRVVFPVLLSVTA